jgi:2-keto-4-pentenoate hydratase
VSPDELHDWSRRLLADLDAGQPGRSFICPAGLPARDAYDLQQEVARLRERRGERVIGYKVGCTSPSIQEQLGVREPIFGRVFDTGWFPAASRLSHARFPHLAVEGELAVRLSRDLPGSSLPDCAYVEAVGSVFPVIELHHYDRRGAGPSLPGLIATGGMHGGLVPAGRETPCSGSLPAVRGLEVRIGGDPSGATAEPWAMGDPAATLRWLSARLAEFGLALALGQVILTGSMLPLFPVGPGARVVVEARPLGESVAEVDP